VDSGVRTTARDDGSAAGRDGPASVDGGTAGGNGGTAGGKWRRSGWKWRHGRRGRGRPGWPSECGWRYGRRGRGRWGWPSERGWRYASRGRPIRWEARRAWMAVRRAATAAQWGRPAGDAAGVASMVVIVDETTDQFAAYDRDGQVVHDYHSLLDFGDQFQNPVVSVSNQITAGARRLGPPVRFGGWLSEGLGPAAGPFDHRRGGASRGRTDSVRIKISSVAGDVLADFEFAGDCRCLAFHPRKRYLVRPIRPSQKRSSSG